MLLSVGIQNDELEIKKIQRGSIIWNRGLKTFKR